MLTADTFNLDTFCHALHREEQQEARIDHLTPIRQPRPVTDWRRQLAQAARQGIAARGHVLKAHHFYLTTTGRR